MAMLTELYKASRYSNILHDIDGVTVVYDPAWKNVGVSLSGGADSTILTYIICTLITESNASTNVHIISNIRCWKTRPWQKWINQYVYDYFVKTFPRIRFKRHENFIPPDLEWGDKGPNIIDEYGKLVSGDIIELRSFGEYIKHQENLEAYYNGVTKNPSIEIHNRLTMRDVEPTVDNFHLTITEHMECVVCHPFRFVAKDWIVRQYKNYNVDNLLNLTRSCEGEFEGLNYKTYTPGQYVPVCGKCFWCQERDWAIEQNK
jgi:hypothetical protein